MYPPYHHHPIPHIINTLLSTVHEFFLSFLLLDSSTPHPTQSSQPALSLRVCLYFANNKCFFKNNLSPDFSTEFAT